jgi:imidazoleglycerol-phosphate dehydratase
MEMQSVEIERQPTNASYSAVDGHHSAEDTFIALGQAFKSTLESSASLARFRYTYTPLDEALSHAVIELSNRPYSAVNITLKRERIGDLSTEMIPHCLQSFVQGAGAALRVDYHKCI